MRNDPTWSVFACGSSALVKNKRFPHLHASLFRSYFQFVARVLHLVHFQMSCGSGSDPSAASTQPPGLLYRRRKWWQQQRSGLDVARDSIHLRCLRRKTWLICFPLPTRLYARLGSIPLQRMVCVVCGSSRFPAVLPCTTIWVLDTRLPQSTRWKLET